MRFRFCGDADCPDWILAEINTLSRLSSVKLKSLTQVVCQGIFSPPIDMNKAEKLLADSKLDSNIDLKACVSCLSFIISATVRFNCNSSALHSELQQLGLPREHSTSIKRVLDDQIEDLTRHFKNLSLKVNPLQEATIKVDDFINCATLELTINGKNEKLCVVPNILAVLLKNLKQARAKMVLLEDFPAI